MRVVDHPLAANLTAPMTQLGFGCAPLLGRASRKESLEALAAAFDAGTTFFDTARSYGDGQSESVLGAFLAEGGRRNKAVVCTKVGILPAARNWKHYMKPMARAAVRLVPSLREAVQRKAAEQSDSGRFTLADIENSFTKSLRELRTDYVDLLLLHAAPMSVLEQDDLLAAMNRLVEQGKVRVAGISGDHDVIAATFERRPPVLQTAQFAMNPSTLAFTEQTARNADLLLVANHPFAGPAGVATLKEKMGALAKDKTLSADLRKKLGETGDPQLFPELVFGLILSETGIAAVLPAMMKREHIRANIAAIEHNRFTAAELAEVRAKLIAG